MPKASHATSWMPALDRGGGPVYLAIAEAIAADIAAGRLQPGTRLPPQRALAEALGIDFTTVTRAYAEARQTRAGRGPGGPWHLCPLCGRNRPRPARAAPSISA